MQTITFTRYNYDRKVVETATNRIEPSILSGKYREIVSGQLPYPDFTDSIYSNDTGSLIEGTTVYDGTESIANLQPHIVQLNSTQLEEGWASLHFATTIPETHTSIPYRYQYVRVEEDDHKAGTIVANISYDFLKEFALSGQVGPDDPRRIPVSFQNYYVEIDRVTTDPNYTTNAWIPDGSIKMDYYRFKIYFKIKDRNNDSVISEFEYQQPNSVGAYVAAADVSIVLHLFDNFYSKYWGIKKASFNAARYSTGEYDSKGIYAITIVPSSILYRWQVTSGGISEWHTCILSEDGNAYTTHMIWDYDLLTKVYNMWGICNSLDYNIRMLLTSKTIYYDSLEDPNFVPVPFSAETEFYNLYTFVVPIKVSQKNGITHVKYISAYDYTPDPEPTPDPDVPPTPDPQPDPDDDTDPVPTDNIDGLNGYTIPEINALHPANNNLFCMNTGALARFRDEVENITFSKLLRLMAQVADDIKLTDVIVSLLEYPFNPQMFLKNGRGIDYREAAVILPGGAPLTIRKNSTLKTFTTPSAIRWYVRSILPNGESFSNDYIDEYVEQKYNSTIQTLALTADIPDSYQVDYFNYLLKRWFEIDFGTKEIVRRQENSLDFEATDYILTLPLCQPIKLNNFELFRSNGDPYNGTSSKTYLSIKAILDVETGDMLYNVYTHSTQSGTDKQLILQQGVNIATERAVIGTDTVAPMRQMISTIKSTATGLTSVSTSNYSTTIASAGKSASKGATQSFSQQDPGTSWVSEGMMSDPTERISMTPSANVHQGQNKSMMANLGRSLNGSIHGDPIATELNFIEGIIKAKVAEMPVTRGSTEGGATLAANMIPFLDIFYPIPVISAKVWKKEMGLKSATFGYAQGYNRYSAVQRIIDSTGTMTNNERAALEAKLKGGFIYYGKSNPWS